MRNALFGLCFLFLILYVAPIGVRPMTLPDETRYSEVPREMLADGDWVVPRLCGLRYFEKPPMGYWLTATSMAIFGENRFAVRLPAALATGISAALLALLVGKVTGALAPALWTAFIFLTMPFVFALGVTNVLDAPFAMCVTGTVVSAFLAIRETASSRKFAWLAAAGAFAGCGFLIKGFLAFVLPAMVIGPFLLFERRWRDIFTLPWVPLTVATIVVLPWVVAIHLREPDYWRYFVMVEHIQRFLTPMKGQHPEPFWFLTPFLVAAPLLWTFLAPALIRRLPAVWTEYRHLLLLSVIWLIVPFLFFSASSGKLPTYILPCLAPVAILFGIGAWRSAPAPSDRLIRTGCVISTLLAGACLAYFLATPFLPESVRIYGPEETASAVVASTAIAAWFVLSVFAFLAKDAGRSILFAGIAVAPVLASLHFVMPARALSGKAPEQVLTDSAPLVTSETEFISDSYIAPAICWMFKTENVFVSGSGELTYGLSSPEQAHRNLDEEQIAPRLTDPKRTRDSAVVFFDERIEHLLLSLPKPDETKSANGITFLLYRAPKALNQKRK